MIRFSLGADRAKRIQAYVLPYFEPFTGNRKKSDFGGILEVFGIYTSRKYEAAACHDIVDVIGVAVSPTPALEFVRHLALTVITGNGDMHLKKRSLIYDALSTGPIFPTNQ